MARKTKPKILIIAGPNGAGKTTFARTFLPTEAGCTDFINADLIAQGLSPFDPDRAAIQAGKIMLTQIAGKVARQESFAFETTLSGLSYARHIVQWRQKGYIVKLFFLGLPSADVAVNRVAARVAQGGHHIAEGVIRKRFEAGLRNFHEIYSKLVDRWVLYDNAGEDPVVISKG